MSTVQDRLKEIREKDFNNLSQQKFADMLRISQSNIKNLESGTQKKMAIELAVTLSEDYNYALKWLLIGKGPKFENQDNTLKQRSYLIEDMNERISKWGERLQEIQYKNDIKDDKKFAKLLGISVDRYWKIVSEGIEPTFDEIKRIKETFIVRIDDLVFGIDPEIEGTKDKEKESAQRLLEELNLTPEKLALLKNALK